MAAVVEERGLDEMKKKVFGLFRQDEPEKKTSPGREESCGCHKGSLSTQDPRFMMVISSGSSESCEICLSAELVMKKDGKEERRILNSQCHPRHARVCKIFSIPLAERPEGELFVVVRHSSGNVIVKVPKSLSSNCDVAGIEGAEDVPVEIGKGRQLEAKFFIWEPVCSSRSFQPGETPSDNPVDHLLFLTEEQQKESNAPMLYRSFSLRSPPKEVQSKNLIEETYGKMMKSLGLGVGHLTDFVGWIFDKKEQFVTDVFDTMRKIEKAATNVVENFIRDIVGSIERLINEAISEFLDGLQSWIYPPPPKHIFKGNVWQNWGNSLRSTSQLIFSDDGDDKRSPRTVEQVREAITMSKKMGVTPIRAFGSCHSWSPLVQTTGALIDNRKFGWFEDAPKDADVFDQDTYEKYCDPKNLYVTPVDPLANNHPTATFPNGIATGTLERFIYYHPRHQDGQPVVGQTFSLGTSTYEDVFTMGGIVAAACHGTGKNYGTVSDWLVAVEFVDAQSQLRRVQVDGKCFVKLSDEDEWGPWDLQDLGLSADDLFKTAICNYGALGIMWNLTIRLIRGFETMFIAEMIPWKKYLDDTKEARKNLNDLQNRSASLEFFYYPFGTKEDGIRWQKNPNCYMLRHVTFDPENKKMLENEGYKIVTKPEWYYLLRDAKTRAGASIMSKILTFLSKAESRIILPYILAQMPANLEYTNGTAIRLPHWRANHSVNAVGAVEQIRCVNIEWCAPMTFNDPTGKGLKHVMKMYSHLIKSIHAYADKRKFPITIVTEIRFFRGSGALLAPEYDPKFVLPEDPFIVEKEPYGGWAAPEIVSGDCNPWWDEFHVQMNKELYKLINGAVPVRNHLAKEYAIIKNQLAVLRKEFERTKTNPFGRFQEVIKKIDPQGIFLTPFMTQFFIENAPQYKPPEGYPYHAEGCLDIPK